MSDFWSFRKMITPVIIQVIFWIDVVLCVIAGFALIVGGVSTPYGGGGQVLAGVLFLLLGPLFVRVGCEVMMVLFRIHETLAEIKKNTEKTQQ